MDSHSSLNTSIGSNQHYGDYVRHVLRRDVTVIIIEFCWRKENKQTCFVLEKVHF